MPKYPKMNGASTETNGLVLTPEILERAKQAMLRGEHRTRLEIPDPIRQWLESSVKPASNGAKK